MTLLQTRPILRVSPGSPGPARPVWVSAPLAAGWCAAVGLVVALALAVAGWFEADAGTFGGAIQVGALGWLVAQGAGLVIGGDGGLTLTAVPLGGVLLIGWLLYRSGRWIARSVGIDSLDRAAAAVAVLTGAYAAVGVVVAVVATPGQAHAPLPRTALALGLVAGSFGGLGIVRGAGLSDQLLGRLPTQVRAVLAGAVAGFWAMICLAAVAFSISMVTHFASAARVAEGADAGLVGGLVLALVGLAAVPNAVLCAGAYLAGPGFVLGTGSSVTPDGVHLGLLPNLPVLAATPRSAGGWWVEALALTPVLAGVVAGVVCSRRTPSDTWWLGAASAAAAGMVGGLLFGASTWLATGAIGPGRMRDIGPSVLATTAVCTVGFAVGSALAAGVWQWWTDRGARSEPVGRPAVD